MINICMYATDSIYSHNKPSFPATEPRQLHIFLWGCTHCFEPVHIYAYTCLFACHFAPIQIFCIFTCHSLYTCTDLLVPLHVFLNLYRSFSIFTYLFAPIQIFWYLYMSFCTYAYDIAAFYRDVLISLFMVLLSFRTTRLPIRSRRKIRSFLMIFPAP